MKSRIVRQILDMGTAGVSPMVVVILASVKSFPIKSLPSLGFGRWACKRARPGQGSAGEVAGGHTKPDHIRCTTRISLAGCDPCPWPVAALPAPTHCRQPAGNFP